MEIPQNISQTISGKILANLSEQDKKWVWEIYLKKYRLKNRFNVLIGLFFLALAGLMINWGLLWGTIGIVVVVFGAMVGFWGLKKILDYDLSPEVSLLDEIIERFEK